jgi:type II secretory pathway pseudopilin PulG
MRTKPSAAFTLLEIITALAILVIVAGLVVSLHSHASSSSSGARCRGEMAMLATALENYKAENGAYPKEPIAGDPDAEGATDRLKPKVHFDPMSMEYERASLFLYKELSGDKGGPSSTGDPDGVPEAGEPVYLKEYDRNRLLMADRDPSTKAILRVRGFQDPWGYFYGYSTAAAHEEMRFQRSLTGGAADGNARKTGDDMPGFNLSGYDLWSTSGSKPATPPASTAEREKEQAKWQKNW